MREYSRRERLGFGVLALCFWAGALIFAYILAADSRNRTVVALLGELGLVFGAALFLKISVTGTSTAFFERSVKRDGYTDDDDREGN